jgi:hypothetical protein
VPGDNVEAKNALISPRFRKLFSLSLPRGSFENFTRSLQPVSLAVVAKGFFFATTTSIRPTLRRLTLPTVLVLLPSSLVTAVTSVRKL